jgi:hypothetical protein
LEGKLKVSDLLSQARDVKLDKFCEFCEFLVDFFWSKVARFKTEKMAVMMQKRAEKMAGSA